MKKTSLVAIENALLQAAWRLFNVWLPVRDDPGKDSVEVTPALARKVERILGVDDTSEVPIRTKSITVVRKTYDSRPSEAGLTSFMYVLLVDHQACLDAGVMPRHNPGKQERCVYDSIVVTPTSIEFTTASI